MASANWTPSAVGDMEEIAYWIAEKDQRPETARRIVEEMKAEAQRFAKIPHAGQRHPDIREDWLYFRFKRWLIFYRIIDEGIDVLRVIDSARDFPRLFG